MLALTNPFHYFHLFHLQVKTKNQGKINTEDRLRKAKKNSIEILNCGTFKYSSLTLVGKN